MNRKTLFLITIALLTLSTAFTGCLDGGSDNKGKETPSPPPANWPYEDVRNFTTINLATNETYNTSWAVFNRSKGGNCCEHYLATTHSGWIMNLGGEYPTWSEDRGKNWSQYAPITRPVDGLGEGAIIEAPNGDILANSWYPYTGDKLYSYFYDASTGQWSWQDNQIHAPFYDRSWQCVVPGPIHYMGQTYPYASLIVSNYWRNSGIGYLLSVDGLTYFPFPDPDTADYMGADLTFSLEGNNGTMMDYMIPHREMYAVSLLNKGGLLLPHYFSNGDNAYLDTDLVWHRHKLPEGYSIPSNHLVIDSTGAMHSVEKQGTTLIYHLSLDAGKTWTSRNFTWPTASRIEEWEFKANGALGLAVINMRVQDGDTDKDIVYHIRDYRESLEPDTITLLGLGDIDATSGAGNDVRFDFASLAILPDGGVVCAFEDSTDADPLFALELEVPYTAEQGE